MSLTGSLTECQQPFWMNIEHIRKWLFCEKLYNNKKRTKINFNSKKIFFFKPHSIHFNHRVVGTRHPVLCVHIFIKVCPKDKNPEKSHGFKYILHSPDMKIKICTVFVVSISLKRSNQFEFSMKNTVKLQVETHP